MKGQSIAGLVKNFDFFETKTSKKYIILHMEDI